MDYKNIISWVIIILYVVLGLLFIGGVVWWTLSDQANNIKAKQKSSILVAIVVGVFYLLRFGSISILSTLSGQSLDMDNFGNGFVAFLRLIQVFIIGILPTFIIMQSYIFEYQYMITERIESKQKRNVYLIYSISITAGLLLLLEMLIRLF